METSDMKKCLYCAELIKSEAIKCRYCGSNLSPGISFDKNTPWLRINRGKRIAGVCTGLAHMFDSPTTLLPIRLLFILSTVVYGFGAIVYVALWVLMEKPTDVPGPPYVAQQPVMTSTPQPAAAKRHSSGRFSRA